MRLICNAALKFLIGILLIGVFLFLPAGTLDYPNARLFFSLLFIPMFLLGILLYLKAPTLLQKRLNHKEKNQSQRKIVSLSALMFPACFILSALDFRFGWSNVPSSLVVLSAVLFLIGYGIYAEVMRENAFLSRTIEVQENQILVSTGLYSIVRHPMYLATLFMFLPIPLILGSFWGLIPISIYPLIIVIRILNEEKVLSEGLDGYSNYMKKVKYKLIPWIW